MTFDELVVKCKCGVHLTVNAHRDFYESVDEYLTHDSEASIPAEDFARMREANTVYELQFYPDTPIGSYTVYGLSLNELLEKAATCFEAEK